MNEPPDKGPKSPENRYSSIVEGSPQGIVIQQDGCIVYANSAMAKLFGFPSASDMIGLSTFDDLVAEEERPQLRERTAAVYRGEQVPQHSGWRGRHNVGELIWVSSHAHISEWEGQPSVTSFYTDITATKKAEDKLQISETRYRRLFETAQDGVLLLDPETRKITDANPFMTMLLGYSHEQLVGKEMFEIGLLKDEAASQQMFRDLKKSHQVRYEDLPLRGESGRHQDVEVVANLYDENGHAVIQCNIRDITMRKRTEEQSKLLLAEVNHRAKNLLGVVQALARQTGRSGDPATFMTRLTERIGSLAASQDLLVDSQWQGVEVSKLVEAQLGHFKDLIGTRVILDGPTLLLTPRAAQGIGMALHELATNAAKYGSLSSQSGLVRIAWKVAAPSQSVFSMSWLEEGGPEVLPPTRKGFGQTVIGPMAEAAVDGTVEIGYQKSGFSWKLRALVADILEKKRADEPERNAGQ